MGTKRKSDIQERIATLEHEIREFKILWISLALPIAIFEGTLTQEKGRELLQKVRERRENIDPSFDLLARILEPGRFFEEISLASKLDRKQTFDNGKPGPDPD